MRDFSIDLIWTKVQIAITAIGGWLGYFLGGMDGLMIALIVLMTLDYISGVMCRHHRQETVLGSGASRASARRCSS